MPKLKQPASLEEIALNVLHKFVLDYCNELSVNDKLDELRQGVSIIKKHICSFIPWPLLAEFSNRFIDEFCSDKRPNSHKRAALEIVMDMKIVGLRCTGQMIKLLDPKDLRRLRILKELDVQLDDLEINLENFLLDELTTFIYSSSSCTNFHLKVIGQNCPKLQVLNVSGSEVTDEGLCALSLCSELRVVDVSDCPVSHNGINSLLSVNQKVEELSHCDTESYSRKFSKVFLLDSSVRPLISRFSFQSEEKVHLLNLQTIVPKFPNLTHLTMNCSMTEDLTILKSLNKLTGINIGFRWWPFQGDVDEMFESLKQLLTYIGSNITILKVDSYDWDLLFSQDDVNFVFTFCPNLEYFGFDPADGLVVIPPFQKLKELIPRAFSIYRNHQHLTNPQIEFGIMLSLETLSLDGYRMNVKEIESIMLDGIKFPRLSVIETDLKAEEITHLEEIARNRNLDFKIKMEPELNTSITNDDDAPA